MKENNKKYLYFCYGDSNEASTWSNVPYCMAKALENKGIDLVRINMANHPRIEHFYDCVIRRVLKLLTGKAIYFHRTRINKWLVDKTIKYAVNTHKDSNLCLFFGYGFYNHFNDIPSLLFADWSLDIENLRNKRKESFVEKRYLKQERRAIMAAEHVITIFPRCAEQMRELYPGANIHYLGGNVVNVLEERGERREDRLGCRMQDEGLERIQRKMEGRRVLFIGKPDRYMEAARKVVEAVSLLQEKDRKVELDIIGITRDRFYELPEGVRCHGYLHKDNKEECRRYYDLLRRATVIVNPTPKWAAYSSTIEAMYYYTPLIVSPYEDFVQEFGEDIDFGLYNREFTTACIAQNIRSILDHPNYPGLCRAAHEAVKDYTWENYVEKLLQLIA